MWINIQKPGKSMTCINIRTNRTIRCQRGRETTQPVFKISIVKIGITKITWQATINLRREMFRIRITLKKWKCCTRSKSTPTVPPVRPRQSIRGPTHEMGPTFKLRGTLRTPHISLRSEVFIIKSRLIRPSIRTRETFQMVRWRTLRPTCQTRQPLQLFKTTPMEAIDLQAQSTRAMSL